MYEKPDSNVVWKSYNYPAACVADNRKFTIIGFGMKFALYIFEDSI
jgi:hypothetical protein